MAIKEMFLASMRVVICIGKLQNAYDMEWRRGTHKQKQEEGRTRNGVRVRRTFLRHLRARSPARSHIARINALSNPTKGTSQLKIGSGIEKYSGNANNNT